MVDFYSKTYNLRFYHSPKCGMTTIRNEMGFAFVDVSEIPSDSISFAIIRNPLDRFISSFKEQLKYNDEILKGTTEQLVRDVTFDAMSKIFLNDNIEDAIDALVTEIETNGFFDGHHISQYDYLQMEQHGRSIDNIDYFINYDSFTDEIYKIFGIKLKSHLNKSNIDNNSIMVYFKKHKNRIIDIYNKDYDLYNRLTNK